MISEPFLGDLKKVATENAGWRDLKIDQQSKPHISSNGTVKKSLLNLVHISDTHICDAQSPARVEYLDRFADPHHPASALIGTLIGTYRAQEILTTQVLHSMIESINRIESTPITKSSVDAVLVTGDLTDNAQVNELNWFNTLAQGGTVHPDSGATNKWEGAGGEHYSRFFWNPHGTPTGESDDFPRSLYGFPTVPELLDAIRAPFVTPGLIHEWLPVHGNHDALLQGTVVPDAVLREVAISDLKIFELDNDEALQALVNVTEVGPARYPLPKQSVQVAVTKDVKRDFVTQTTWSLEFEKYYKDKKAKYWRRDFETITLIALDTVNPYGGWQGSLDQEQFEWLKLQCEESQNRLIVITSHHPLDDLYNGYTVELTPRILRESIKEFLLGQPNIVAWICGHTHQHKITHFKSETNDGFWQIETASLIDWPQQGRVIEFYIDDTNQLCIATTLFDHQGTIASDYTTSDLSDINNLAGLSRVLSVNDWQRRSGAFDIQLNEGSPSDQNVILKRALPITQ